VVRPSPLSLLICLAIVLAALTAFVRWLEPRMAFFPSPGEDETPRTAGLPFEAVTIETTDGERLRAWAIHGPQPRARIVYFHGNGGNLSNWSPILSAIARHGYSVLAVDYRGYGLSTGHPTERGLYRDTDATVARPWSEADRGLPLVYWGRSLGTALAAYAATVRKPDGIIIEAGFTNVRAVVRNSPVLAVFSLLASYRFPAADLLNLANVPVLQLHGDRDSTIPIEVGRELFQKITAPKEFVVIPGGDHNDEAPRDAAAYWSAIDGFIAARRR
jgi:alpha-beta hydrolase superfamily lysophospholipase